VHLSSRDETLLPYMLDKAAGCVPLTPTKMPLMPSPIDKETDNLLL